MFLIPEKLYTGVGCRKTPEPILTLMFLIGYRQAENGWTLRSGGADGADNAFYRGALEYFNKKSTIYHKLAEIYIPKQGFNKLFANPLNPNVYNFKDYKEYVQALEIAKNIIPYWDRLPEWNRNLHGRNIFQVLGHNLKKPSHALLCWKALDNKGEVTGGTRTAWVCAQQNNVRTINLYNPKSFEAALRYVGITELELLRLAGIHKPVERNYVRQTEI
jgi:hypothetical protein